jgi:hypothetical protein
MLTCDPYTVCFPYDWLDYDFYGVINGTATMRLCGECIPNELVKYDIYSICIP